MNRLHATVVVATVLLAVPAAPSAAQIEVVSGGNVGIGTSSPATKLHVIGNLRIDGRVTAPVTLGTGGAVQPLVGRNPEGGFLISTNGPIAGSADLLRVEKPNGAIIFRVEASGAVFVNSSQVHPDFVFAEGYPLESIEEHARAMWQNQHLPAVGPGRVDEDGSTLIDLGGRTLGMLEELEKAHIYIEQLHARLGQSEQQVAEVTERNEELARRLEALESALQRENGAER